MILKRFIESLRKAEFVLYREERQRLALSRAMLVRLEERCQQLAERLAADAGSGFHVIPWAGLLTEGDGS